MNFMLFGIFLIEFCSAFGCKREKERIKELYQQKRELRSERNELKEENEKLKRKLDALEVKEEFK
jgi:cell shape-determining protein MreC